MTPEEKLKTLGIDLPDIPKPLGTYVPLVRTGSLVYLSGMLPLKDGQLLKTGRVGESVSPEDGALCARAATINALAVLRFALGSLDRVVKCVKISGFVSSATDFTQQPMVINGAVDLLFDIFGEAGRHARSAVGVNILPLNSPVEVEFIFEISEDVSL